MAVLLANDRDVTALLPMQECMRVMAVALTTLARGDAALPLRTVMRLPDSPNAFALMPAYLGSPNAVGVKVITVFPGNDATAFDSHQGAVLLFDTEYGRLLAILDASSITAIRTAAVSGVATDMLARSDARVLAILGSGVQAATHLEAMRLARPIERVRVWSRTPSRLRAFTERAAERHGLPIEPCSSAEEAVDGADIVCTTTASREPVLLGEWLAPGAHVNAVGASLPTARELDGSAMARSRLIVDRRESALNEAGDFLLARHEGAIGDDHIRGELGELLLGRVSGRTSDVEITLFKSLGLAIEDVAAAHHIHRRATETGWGTWVELGGMRDLAS
jgi:ornithine cyclodeaminase/alanine dehydrogenase-like protein (mu-crystallin family)